MKSPQTISTAITHESDSNTSDMPKINGIMPGFVVRLKKKGLKGNNSWHCNKSYVTLFDIDNVIMVYT